MRRALVVVAVVACKSKTAKESTDVPVEDREPSRAWRELEGYPHVAAVRTVALPVRDAPRFEVGGPVIAGNVAIVASSQFGFHAVEWSSGRIAWTKPTGAHVAPPLARGDGAVLIADCLHPPDLPATERLLGCVRVVAADGSDTSHVAIRGAPEGTAEFAAARGPQTVWADHARVYWRRGDEVIAIDPASGAAVASRATPPADDDAAPRLPGIGRAGRPAGHPTGSVHAVRLDGSLERDYIAALAANGSVAWVWQLPRLARADPIGLAITSDHAVVAFHDGDTLTVLPRANASKNPTP